jgi:hypothetical protein
MPFRFSRPSLVAATELLARHSHGEFAIIALKFGLQDKIPTGSFPNLTIKAATVAAFVVEQPDALVATPAGERTRAELLVTEAVRKFNPHYEADADKNFRRALARDGYDLDVAPESGGVTLLPIVPQDLDLPTIDDEVHRLLRQFQLVAPLGHLDQAIEAHRLGGWASANAQLRSFLEGLLSEIATRFYAAPSTHTFDNCLTLLADQDFLSTERSEWRKDGKGFVQGLFKLLHTQGSHPGLSDEDDSAFRLHVVLVTARSYLRRLIPSE